MKKIYCIILMLGTLYSNSLFSQTSVYHPFPENYGRWEVSITDYTGVMYDVRYERYITNGDTIINGTTYNKVTIANSTMPYSWITIAGYVPFGPSRYCFAYRNDIPNKKVYRLDSVSGSNGNPSVEKLWYDFNLNVGDSLDSDGIIKVSSVDSTLVCNEYHKTFLFDFLYGGPVTPKFIEGIGCDENFLDPDLTHEFRLDVFFYYQTSFYCTPTSIDEINRSTSQLEVFPNPTENTLQINFTDGNSFLLQNYSILDCLGRVVFSGSISDNNIDVSMLSKGLYFLKIEDKENNILQSKFVKQ